MESNNKIKTPSEFYRQLRPEYFSDSEIISQHTLAREILAYELSKISTNQKQDEFETLCRRLAEKFISPNLIPQVGPTGGGDGKTDSETYPVSEKISDRWFTPENGWDKNENWAFAISAKEAWKGKVKSDIKKIVETKRGYTRVYFMSNQLIPSKKKKDAQDEFIKEFEIDVVILDGEWILEKIYNNKLTDLAVDALNMSDSFKSKQVRIGSNDVDRQKELDILEENITNQNRYSEYDYQLTEDALKSVILSRMLEKPRDDIEGKFDRALRFAKKLNNPRQLMRLYYQKAWTYLNWYDDYRLFVENFLEFKKYMTKNPNIDELEDYCTLFTSLYSLKALKRASLENLGIDIDKEKDDIHLLLENTIKDQERLSLSLFARTEDVFLQLIYREKNVDELIYELSEILHLSKNRIDYPFEIIQRVIEEIFSNLFPNHQGFDELINLLAEISAKRTSELDAGFIFLRRASQKLEAGFYKESIVYFGKSIVKIAKEETQNYLYFALLGLGMAYERQGLIWASNNCYMSACTFAFKFTDKKGIPSDKVYNVVKQLLTNELFIGRIPYIFLWNEMLLIFEKALNILKEDDILYDATLAIRFLYTYNAADDYIRFLPTMLEHQLLPLSYDIALYKQGYIEEILDGQDVISNEKDLNEHMTQLSQQPFVEQMIYNTNFMVDNTLALYSNILGCKFIVNFPKDKEMLFVAETLLAFFESFMATSMSNVHSHKEEIIINCIGDSKEIKFEYNEETFTYNFYIQDLIEEINLQSYYEVIMKLTIDILGRNFLMDNFEEHFKSLFETEEVHERLSLILNHRNNIINIFGNNPKVFFHDWIDYYKPDEYPYKREEEIIFEYKKISKDKQEKYTKSDIDTISHNKVKTHTIINATLWDKAKWRGVGFAFHPEDGLYMLLAFDNIEYGKKIFDNWIQDFGFLDKEDIINITIIKGINKKEPFSYKVMINKNEKFIKSSASDGIIQMITRFHKMDAKTPDNLNNLISGFKHFKKYKLIPASMNGKGGVEPIFDKAITKISLIVKDAWEIGKNDFEVAVIRKDDTPIIPKEYEATAPILEVMNQLKDKK